MHLSGITAEDKNLALKKTRPYVKTDRFRGSLSVVDMELAKGFEPPTL
jgi:hypothetical protein